MPPPGAAPGFFADWSALGCIFRSLSPPSPSPFDVSRGEGPRRHNRALGWEMPWGPLRRPLSLLLSPLPSSPLLPALSPPFPSEGGGRERGGHLHLPAPPPRGGGSRARAAGGAGPVPGAPSRAAGERPRPRSPAETRARPAPESGFKTEGAPGPRASSGRQ